MENKFILKILTSKRPKDYTVMVGSNLVKNGTVYYEPDKIIIHSR